MDNEMLNLIEELQDAEMQMRDRIENAVARFESDVVSIKRRIQLKNEQDLCNIAAQHNGR